MTLQRFNKLSDRDRRLILNTMAVFVGKLEDGEDSYTLFQVDGFYVEVWCAGGENCMASSISYFEETELLQPYLALINIDSIYSILAKT